MSLQLSKKKRILFAAVIILASISGAVIAGELLLRYRRHYIKRSDRLDPGLFRYDKRLGWRLASNWTGRHRHYDFDVSYSTNRYGFRGDFNLNRKQTGRLYAFVGDSFTFCFGVNDDETFVRLLNSQERQTCTHLNFGVPGFSTDQEYLLIKEQILYFSPDVILLVVYLGNDLFDNELSFPLQANRAKPYFELTTDGLTPKNIPVPLTTKPKGQAQMDLARVVLGEGSRTGGLIARHLGRFELFRLLGLDRYPPDLQSQFDDRFKSAIVLFTAIADRIREACHNKKVELRLILMPGKSFVERPRSPSAQFQDYLRRKIVEKSGKMKVNVIDLAFLLRRQYQKHGGRWFFPNEGHLTPEGHRIVAGILAPLISCGG